MSCIDCLWQWFTQVPSDLSSLLRQRNRWHRGLIDSLLYSKTMFLNPRYGTIGLMAFPYQVFIEALGPLVELFGYVSVVLFYLFGLLSIDFALLFSLVSIVWGMLINVGSILLDNLIYKRYARLWDVIKLCFFGLLEMLGYRQIIIAERLVATFEFWRKDWGKPARQVIRPGRDEISAR